MFFSQELTEQIGSGAAGHSADEELVREHALTLLRWWVFKCQDYVRSIDQETELLENMEHMRGAPGRPVARQPEQAPLTHRQPPVLIIREKMKVSYSCLHVLHCKILIVSCTLGCLIYSILVCSIPDGNSKS